MHELIKLLDSMFGGYSTPALDKTMKYIDKYVLILPTDCVINVAGET